MSNTTDLMVKELNLELIQPSTKNMNKTSQGGSKIVVIGKPGCFAAGTKVLMYNGDIKKVEDINPGEQVMGDDSNPRDVLELCNNIDDMYKITHNNGESVTVNKQHILSLKCCTEYNNIQKGEIIDITVENYIKESDSFKNIFKWYKTGVNFKNQKLEFEPYMLGCWLASGHSATIENINAFFLKEYKVLYKKINNNFYTYLKQHNLTNNIYLPSEYKLNLRSKRLQLLAGLIDIKGYIDHEKCYYEISDKSEKLIEDIIFVCRSLGFSVKKTKLYKYMEPYYRCHIYGKGLEEIPTKIKIQNQNTIDNLSSEFSVEYVGFGRYFGFTLNGNHRFLLDDFSVVHNTGKSTLISSILYSKKHIYPVGLVMSGTEDSNGFYKKMFPSTFVYNKYDEVMIENLIKRQKIAKQHLENPWAVLLLDDCTDDIRIFNKPLQQALYKNGRHWKLLYILSLQYCMDIKPVIRNNVDGIFILREPSIRLRESLYKNYASIIPDFTIFCELMDKLTTDYCSIFILNATQSNSWEDCVFYYKATPTPDGFKFGSEDFWDFHNERYNLEYTDPIIV